MAFFQAEQELEKEAVKAKEVEKKKELGKNLHMAIAGYKGKSKKRKA